MSLSKHPDSSFAKWLDELGTAQVSKVLKTCHSTVRHWRLGYSLPRPWQMKRIKEITKGKISYAQIIEGKCSPLTQRGGSDG